MTDPFKPKRTIQPVAQQDPGPQFPLERLKRIGASTAMVQEIRKTWDEMDEIEQEASASQFEGMSDAELREEIESFNKDRTSPMEAPKVPNFDDMTIPEVMAWVEAPEGDAKERAKLALKVERRLEDNSEGKGRKTLITKLKKVVNG